MKRTLLKIFCTFLSAILLLNCYATKVMAQRYEMDWVNAMGGTELTLQANFSTEYITSTVLDKNNNVYSVGVFNDTTDFDPGPGVMVITAGKQTNPNVRPPSSTFIYKTDAAGNPIWAKKIFGKSDVPSLGIDDNNNLFIVGEFFDTVDFDPGPSVYNLTPDAACGAAMFITKLDSGGNFIWAKKIDGDVAIYPKCLEVDNNNNLNIVGLRSICSDSVDFDPGSGVFKLYDDYRTFILRLDNSGDFQWVSSIYIDLVNYGWATPHSVTTDNSGNVLVTGDFFGSIDFNPDPDSISAVSNIGMSDIFILKLDNQGKYLWNKTIGGPGFNVGNSIAVDNNGSVYTTGYYGYTASGERVDFDPANDYVYYLNTDTADRGGNMFIFKLDSNGNFDWAKQIGGIGGGSDQGLAITISEHGLVYASGSLVATSANALGVVDFDPGSGVFNAEGELGKMYHAVSVLDTAGNFVWGGFVGPPTATWGTGSYTYSAILHDDKGNIYLGGEYWSYILNQQDTFYFDPAVPGNAASGRFEVHYGGAEDIFLLRLSPCRQVDTTIMNACDSFVFRGQTYAQGGIHLNTVTNRGTCDSIFVLQLDLSHTDKDTFLVSTCDSFRFDHQTYLVSGNYLHTFSKRSGCDSVIMLELKINGTTPDTAILQTGRTLTSLAAEASYQWIDCNNNTAILGATAQSYIPENNGSYAVVVTGSGGCIDTSGCYTVGGTSGINIINGDNVVNIFPNPATDVMYIATSLPLENAEVRIVNATGQIMWKGDHLNGSHITLKIKELSPAIYTVEIVEKGAVIRLKVVKG